MANNRVSFSNVTAASAVETQTAAVEAAAQSTTTFGRRSTFREGATYTVLPYDDKQSYVSRDGGDNDRVWPVLRLQNVANPSQVESVFLSSFSEPYEDAKTLEELERTGSFNLLVNSLRASNATVGAWMQAIVATLAGRQIVVNKQTCFFNAYRDGSCKKTRQTLWDIVGQPTTPAQGHSVAEMANK